MDQSQNMDGDRLSGEKKLQDEIDQEQTRGLDQLVDLSQKEIGHHTRSKKGTGYKCTQISSRDTG